MRQNLQLLLGAALVPLAVVAHAQTGLPSLPNTGTTQQVYGLIDVGVDRTVHAPTGQRTRIQSGQQTGSHWGLRGREDLGNGLAAVYNLEAGFNADTGTSISPTAYFDRRAIVGLRSEWGTLTLGRQPDFTEWLNPLTTNRLAGNIALGVHGLAASGQSNRVNVVRVDNSVRFESARWNGFSVGAWTALSERTPSWNAKAVGAGLRYDSGPLQAMLLGYKFTGDDAQWNGSNAAVANAAANNIKRTDRIVGGGASYDLGVVRLSGMFTDEKNELAAQTPHTRVYDINATFPMGSWVLGAGFQKQVVSWADGRAKDVFNQFSLGVQYVLSRRTLVYAHAATMNTSAGDFARLGASPGASSTDRQGGYRLGIRHIF